MEPPALTGPLVTPGAVDPRWHVGACWFSGIARPPSFATAVVTPERPVRMFAARDSGQKVAAIKALFDAQKLAKSDGPRWVAATTSAFKLT